MLYFNGSYHHDLKRCRYAGGPVLESDVERAFTLQASCRWHNNIMSSTSFSAATVQGIPVALHVAIETLFS